MQNKKKLKFFGILSYFFTLCTTNLCVDGIGFAGDEDENDSHVVLYSQEESSYYI